MDNTKTFEEQVIDLKKITASAPFQSGRVSKDSLDQMIKAHELKYIENVINTEEENKIVQENLDDFFKYSEEIQRLALEAMPAALKDPDYFSREGANKDLIKPIMILQNIETKKNEAKIKAWTTEYHGRLIVRLRQFRSLLNLNTAPEVKGLKAILKCLVKIFSK